MPIVMVECGSCNGTGIFDGDTCFPCNGTGKVARIVK